MLEKSEFLFFVVCDLPKQKKNRAEASCLWICFDLLSSYSFALRRLGNCRIFVFKPAVDFVLFFFYPPIVQM